MKIAMLMIMFGTTALAQTKPMLVMHGGAGTITRASMTPEMEKQYREKLEEALRTGHAVLMKGGSSLEAVEASIRILEDSPLFNAGKGAVFTHEGKNELDDDNMNSQSPAAGSADLCPVIKIPI